MTKQERHEQAIEDAASACHYTVEELKNKLARLRMYFAYEDIHYAVAQRERVLELEEEIGILKAALGYATLEPSADTSDRQIEKWTNKAREFLRSAK